MNQKALSVVLGTYNRLGFLKLTIESLRRELNSCDFRSEIIIIDGGSSDGTMSWLTKQKDIISIIQHNRGEWAGKKIERRSWGYFMNLGFKAAQGKYVCMISDDCLLVPGALKNGYNQFETMQREDKKVGAIAFFWRNWPDANYYWIGKFFNIPFVNHGIYLNEAIRKVGFLDEENYKFYYADGDFSLRIYEAGYRIIAADDSFIEHYNYANLKLRIENSSSAEVDLESFKAKWRNAIFYDEIYFDPKIDRNRIGIYKIPADIEKNNSNALAKWGKIHRRNKITNLMKRIVSKLYYRQVDKLGRRGG